MEKLVVWGAGGHALVVADIVRLENRYRVVGFLDDVNLDRTETQYCQAPLYVGQRPLDLLREDDVRWIILAIGDCEARLERAGLARAQGFSLATAIHPRAVIAAGVRVGEGTVVAAGAVIAPEATIAANVIINTAASVDHDSVVEDGAHVSVGARLGGRVRIGEAALIGMGASVLPNVHVGERALIGAGAVVVENIPPRAVAYGVPARVRHRVEANG